MNSAVWLWMCMVGIASSMTNEVSKDISCFLPKLRNLDSCVDADGRELSVDQDYVPGGTLCVHETCGVQRVVECQHDGSWSSPDGEITDDENCNPSSHPRISTDRFRKRQLLFRVRIRIPFFRSPPPAPPPPPPPPPECGHPGTSPVFSVSVTSTSQGGVATYACKSGYQHSSGDLRRTCQSNKLWTGSEPKCVFMNYCSRDPCVNGGTCTNIPDSYTCRCPEIWKGTRCEQVAYVCARNPCQNHVRCEDGASMYTCVCQPGWSGQHCQIPAECGFPGNVDNCDVTVSKTTLGGLATYLCHHDYNKTTGDSSRECLTDSTWSGAPPVCLYAASCTSNPCNNGATCVNLLADFECHCMAGWTGKTCDTDIQPPLVSNCQKDIYINATDTLTFVNWTNPQFTDPMNTELRIISNYHGPDFTFPWGDFTVQYTATKLRNGLTEECVFNITVRPTPCSPLNVPTNGAVLCNTWKVDYGQVCMVACKDNFSLPTDVKYDRWWVCGASGHWTSPEILPDCSLNVHHIDDILPYHSDYGKYIFRSCDEGYDVTKLKQLYIDRMLAHEDMAEFCRIFPDGCSFANVNFKCDL